MSTASATVPTSTRDDGTREGGVRDSMGRVGARAGIGVPQSFGRHAPCENIETFAPGHSAKKKPSDAMIRASTGSKRSWMIAVGWHLESRRPPRWTLRDRWGDREESPQNQR
jgi:hypothetical protein